VKNQVSHAVFGAYRLTVACSLAQRLQRSFIICFTHVKKTKKCTGWGFQSLRKAVRSLSNSSSLKLRSHIPQLGHRGGKSRDLLIQLSMQVSENVIVWTPLLDVMGADGSVL
jgi:hypothetical protein